MHLPTQEDNSTPSRTFARMQTAGLAGTRCERSRSFEKRFRRRETAPINARSRRCSSTSQAIF